jgi:acyl carrier protein
MEFEKIREVLVEQFGVDESAITLETSIVDDLGADSLDVVELIMAIEETFDIEIPDEVAEEIVTVSDAVEYLKNNN